MTESPSTGTKRKADLIDVAENPVYSAVKVITLLADADVTLKVGQGIGALEIKVSSHVLRLASKVFRTMLESPFIEGTSKVVELKEDDPQIILDFCHIIHHQHSRIEVINAERLRPLIALADMRDCRDALKPWLSSALEEYTVHVQSAMADVVSFFAKPKGFPSSIPGLTIIDIVAFAYVFELDDLFSSATKYYLAGAKDPINIDKDDSPAFPPIQSNGQCLYGLLSRARISRSRNLLRRIVGCISKDFLALPATPITSSSMFAYNPNPPSEICLDSYQKYGAFMYWLAADGIHMADLQSYQGPWSDIVKTGGKLAGTETYGPLTHPVRQKMETSRIGSAVDCPPVRCRYCLRNIRQEIGELLSKECLGFKGACLKDFRQKGTL